jgi:acetoacetyl-CoA reductase
MTKKIALVTGGIGGIGTQICRRLAEQGLSVVANDLPAADSDQAREWQEQMTKEGYDFGYVAANVADFDSCALMVREVDERHGPIYALVNCAGITRDRTLRKMDYKDWHDVININLNGMFHVTRQVIGGMLERGEGRIVNLSSVNGQQGQFGQTNYSAAKAGVHGFSMALAREVASKGITVNTVSPGYIATAMTAAITEDVRNQIVATIPMRRMGNPDEVAAAVAFLVGPDASYITGADLSVNGGLRMS